ncbi:MAG: hypothetical protein JWQ96_375 [Segetibacter sp.]|nr:hypothetical protein [Segetibacter sp.]
MIQANELRIGNLVLWNPKLVNPNITLSPLHIQVHSIAADNIGYVFPNIENRVEPFEDDVVQLGRYKQLNEIEPIELTREILENAVAGPNKSVMKQLDEQRVEWITNDFTVTYIKKNLLYVHQLQNLYFALVGYDLEVVLKETS